MSQTDRITLTFYPLWMKWVGSIFLYLALMIAPLAAISWIESLIPTGLQQNGKILLNGVVLPILYVSLYGFLHRIGARCQNFVFLVALLYGSIIFAEGQRALATGSVSHWFGALVCLIYTLGFAWLGYKGYVANRLALADALNAEREAQIDMHAEAIVRAQRLQGRQDTVQSTS